VAQLVGRRLTIRGVAAGLCVLLVAAVCVSFGFWQLERLEQRRAQNAALLAAQVLPILNLDASTAAALTADPGAFLYRRVRVRGGYEPAGEVVLRGRSHQGQPGVHLYAPLELEGSGMRLLVNRGWIPTADAATIDPRPFTAAGVQEIEGLVQIFPAAEGAGVPVEREVNGFRVYSLGRLDLRALQARTGETLLPFYVQQLPDPALREPPVRLAPPVPDEGSHLSYALQWFSFAAIFLIGFVVVATRRSR
jgi:surfeit locus 1 family protein